MLETDLSDAIEWFVMDDPLDIVQNLSLCWACAPLAGPCKGAKTHWGVHYDDLSGTQSLAGFLVRGVIPLHLPPRLILNEPKSQRDNSALSSQDCVSWCHSHTYEPWKVGALLRDATCFSRHLCVDFLIACLHNALSTLPSKRILVYWGRWRTWKSTLLVFWKRLRFLRV